MEFAGSIRRAAPARGGGLRNGLVVAVALVLAGLTPIVAGSPGPASAAQPTLTPFTPGRHVYDYGHLFTLQAAATAESLATSIENAGGGRVVVYTDGLMTLPDSGTLAKAWHVDGLLLTGWESHGDATLGATLEGMLSTEAAKFIADSSSGFETMESFTTSTLARAEGFLRGTHVFDGAGVLDQANHDKAEAEAVALGQKLGATVYFDISMTDGDSPSSTAFFDDLESSFSGSLVVSIGVKGTQIGGFIEADSKFWDAYQTGSPWTSDSLSDETAPGGDTQAEVMRALEAVQPVPNPGEAVGSAAASVRDSITSFFSDRTNVLASLGGLLVMVGAMVGFWFARRRRRREAGYADDDSVLLPAPPAEMTPALAAIVAAPLNSTRAVTVALLDLAAHGRIAFYNDPSVFGQGAGIRVVGDGGAGAGGHVAPGSDQAFERPLGPAEEYLLDGLRAEAGGSAGISPVGFGVLRPLFEQTAERLERTAGERGWLRLETRSVSNVWTVVGLALVAGAAASIVERQPIAFVCLALAGLKVLPGARRMPLPLRTPDGQMTSAMVDAYRRTLRRALAGEPGAVPPWLANAEEAALWGYAWGLEGEVQAFVGRNVGAAMGGLGADGSSSANMTSMSMLLAGLAGPQGANPVGLDTDAIASTLGGLGQGLVVQTGDLSAPGTEAEGR